MAPAPRSRRSFIVEAVSAAAGAWFALAGLLGLSVAALGCEGSKYGGPPDRGGRDTKYGGPDMGPTYDGLGPMDTKYGGARS